MSGKRASISLRWSGPIGPAGIARPPAWAISRRTPSCSRTGPLGPCWPGAACLGEASAGLVGAGGSGQRHTTCNNPVTACRRSGPRCIRPSWAAQQSVSSGGSGSSRHLKVAVWASTNRGVGARRVCRIRRCPVTWIGVKRRTLVNASTQPPRPIGRVWKGNGCRPQASLIVPLNFEGESPPVAAEVLDRRIQAVAGLLVETYFVGRATAARNRVCLVVENTRNVEI
jgi:hypothetical protein